MGTVVNDMAWTADRGAVSKTNRWVDFGRAREGGYLREASGPNIEHGKFRCLHAHHLWGPGTPGDLSQGRELWIESDR